MDIQQEAAYKKRIYYDGISIQNGRPINMDSLMVKVRAVEGDRICLAVICDGVGSLKSGTFASKAAVRYLDDWFGRLHDLQRIGPKMREAVLEINETITLQSKHRGIRSATTLSALLLAAGRYYVVHAGDSRIYSYGADGLCLMTRDDVAPNGKLNKWIGNCQHLSPFYSEGFTEKRVFLLCSDGLYKRMSQTYLIRQLEQVRRGKMRTIVENLTQYVVDHGESDNISVALIKSRE